MPQPASRTRFYLDKRHKKVLGVCSGIADYTGFDVIVVRIFMFLALWMSGGGIIPVYFIAGWLAPDKPREMLGESREEQQFWQGVRASPAQGAREIRSKMRDIDRRLADIEYYVTTENRSLANEIDQLR